MRVRLLRDGGCAILDGDDLLEFDPLVYEVVYCAVPIDPQSLHEWLDGALLPDSEDRAALARMIERGGGIAAAMEELQSQLKALPPPALVAAAQAEETGPGGDPAADAATAAPAEPPSPAPPESAPAPRKSARPPAATAGSGKPDKPRARSVLVVVPGDWTARRIQEQLADSAFAVRTRVTRVDDALDAYRKSRTDLVLLDLAASGGQEVTLAGGSQSVRRFLAADSNARVVATYSIETKPLLLAALRAGASAHLAQPFERADLIHALEKALTSRSWAPAPSSSIVRKNLACAWKADRLLRGGEWEGFVAHSLDLKGVDGSVDESLKPGAAGRLRLRLARQQDPVEIAAEVSTCQRDAARRCWLVRFRLVQPSLDVVDRLSGFLATLRPKRAPGV